MGKNSLLQMKEFTITSEKKLIPLHNTNLVGVQRTTRYGLWKIEWSRMKKVKKWIEKWPDWPDFFFIKNMSHGEEKLFYGKNRFVSQKNVFI